MPAAKKPRPATAPAHLPVGREELQKRREERMSVGNAIRAYDEAATLLRGNPRASKSDVLERARRVLGNNRAASTRLWEHGIPEMGQEPLWQLAHRLCPEVHPPTPSRAPAASREGASIRQMQADAAERVEQAAQQAAAAASPELAAAVTEAVRAIGSTVGNLTREAVLARSSSMAAAADRILHASAARYEVQAEVAAAHAEVIRDELALARNARKGAMTVLAGASMLLRKQQEVIKLAEREVEVELQAAEAAFAAGEKKGRVDVDAALGRLARLTSAARSAMALARDSSTLHRALLKEAAEVQKYAEKVGESAAASANTPDEVDSLLQESQAWMDALGRRTPAHLHVIKGGLGGGADSDAAAAASAVLGEPIGRADLPREPERP